MPEVPATPDVCMTLTMLCVGVDIIMLEQPPLLRVHSDFVRHRVRFTLVAGGSSLSPSCPPHPCNIGK